MKNLIWLAVAVAVLVIVIPVMTVLMQEPPMNNIYFSEEIMARGQEFVREGLAVGTLSRLLNLGLLVFLVMTAPGSALIKRLEQGKGWFAGVALITLVVISLQWLVSLPFSWYLGFVREHRWGLSVQSMGSWWRDYALNSALNYLINLFTLALILWLISRFPKRWWLVAGSSLAILGAIMFMLYPIFIDPLFVEREPMRDPEILAMAQGLADRAGFSLDGVWLERASLKTNRANAMVTGIGPTKRIILWDTLLRDYPPEEVEVVIAHELGHAIYSDTFRGWLGASLAAFGGLGLLAAILNNLVLSKHWDLKSAYQPRVLALILLLMLLFEIIGTPVANTFSRSMEIRADHFALDMTENPKAFISTMVRLAQHNPGLIEPPPIYEWMRYTHPSTMNRVRAGERWMEQRGW